MSKKCPTCGHHPRLTQEDKTCIVASYLQGYTQQHLAMQFGVSQAYISNILKKHDNHVNTMSWKDQI